MIDSLACTIDGSARRGVMGYPPSAPDPTVASTRAQPLPAGPHLLASELTKSVLVQRVAGSRWMVASRPWPTCTVSCVTEAPRRIDGTDRHVDEHSQAWRRTGPLHIELDLTFAEIPQRGS